MTVYALYQHLEIHFFPLEAGGWHPPPPFDMHFKATLIVTYDLILTTLFDSIENLFWNSSLNRFLFKGGLKC
jgi:hypothetical protein